MALAYDPQREPGTPMPEGPAQAAEELRDARRQGANSISASQARAARRREALSHEQAVSAWLRELSARGR
jgi:hypothetical protein